MALREAVLGLLYDSPKTGYEIKRYYSETVKNFWNISDGQLYPMLRKMHEEGLVDKEVVPQSNTANKNIYSITPKGEQTFLDWLKTPVSKFQEMREPLLIKMYFFDKLSKEEVEKHFQMQLEVHRQMLQELHEVEETYKGELTNFRRLIAEVAFIFLEMRVLWISRMMSLLKSGKINGKHKLVPDYGRSLIPAFFQCIFNEKLDPETKKLLEELKNKAAGLGNPDGPRKKGR